MAAQPARVKVHFEPHSVLNEKLKAEGSQTFWFLVPGEAATVGDVAACIVKEFGLQKTCKRGVKLLVRV